MSLVLTDARLSSAFFSVFFFALEATTQTDSSAFATRQATSKFPKNDLQVEQMQLPVDSIVSSWSVRDQLSHNLASFCCSGLSLHNLTIVL